MTGPPSTAAAAPATAVTTFLTVLALGLDRRLRPRTVVGFRHAAYNQDYGRFICTELQAQ